MTPDMILLRRDLMHDEGIRLKPYDDATGKPVAPGAPYDGKLTCGVGHCLDTAPLTPAQAALLGHDGRSAPWTIQQATSILNDDIEVVFELLDSHAAWWRGLDEVRCRVIAELCFNMGWGNGAHGLSSFKHTIAALQNCLYQRASEEMLSSGWAKQVGPNRAGRLSHMIATGIDIVPS